MQAQQIAQIVAQAVGKLGQPGLTSLELGQMMARGGHGTGKSERAGLAAGQTQLTPQQVGESQLVLVVLVVLGGIKTEEVELGLEEGLGVEGG